MRFSLQVFATIFFGLASSVQAWPVLTYDFSGTFDQPVGGTNEFSGSLVYTDTAPSTVVSGSSYGNSTSNRIQMSIDIAGHSSTINVLSIFEYPDNYAELQIEHDQALSSFSSFVTTSINQTDTDFFGNHLSFGLYLEGPGTALPENSPNAFAELDLSKFSTREFNFGGDFDFVSRQASGGVSGTLTSFTLVSTTQLTVPEPSALTLFGLFGIGTLTHRRSRRVVR